MPVIIPIKDLRDTTEISELAHKKKEPIFVTKNGYSDLVVMSSELYDHFAKINHMDRAIRELEKQAAEVNETASAAVAGQEKTDDVSKRIGIAEGEFAVPDDFDAYNDEIADLFEGVAE